MNENEIKTNDIEQNKEENKEELTIERPKKKTNFVYTDKRKESFQKAQKTRQENIAKKNEVKQKDKLIQKKEVIVKKLETLHT